jgi:3-hydroxyacyl-CoA dehydrogenase
MPGSIEYSSNETKARVVSLTLKDRVLHAVLANRPVNALSMQVRHELQLTIQEAEANSNVDVIVIRGGGKTFCGGADIREFGKPVTIWSREVCETIENCAKPVIAAVHGVAFGGGMEIALSAHYRIGTPTSRFALPEVNLGLIPGGGGTQRLPRMIGAKAALEMMLGGRPVSASEAVRLGFIDRVTESENIEIESQLYARALVSLRAPARRSCDAAALDDCEKATREIRLSREESARKYRGLVAPAKIIDAVEAAVTLPFEKAIEREKELFESCMDSPQRSALTHAFFAEKEVLKVPEADRASPRAVRVIGVVGGGTMGAGIAVSLLDGGFNVTLLERDNAALNKGLERIRSVYAGQVKRGRLSTEEAASHIKLCAGTTRYEDLKEADLVIEAVFEEMSVKKEVFARLEGVCKPGAILATNTSYLNINEIAVSTSRPQDVVGLHFFSPANIMKLAEIVVPAQASDEAVSTAFDVARRLKKIPVRAGVCDGFIGNRLLAAYRAAADYMLEDGASPYQIDAAVREFGFPMGPYQVMDLAGGDIAWASRKRKASTRDPRARYVHVADRLCELGWFGQKTGRGFYLYADGAREGVEDQEVEALIKRERSIAGVESRSFTATEIVRRYMAAMINEAANVVNEGIALRPLDIDVVLINGYGFPRYRGGPMKYADDYGLSIILADIKEFAQEDSLFWTPSPLLERLVQDGRSFSSLNKQTEFQC